MIRLSVLFLGDAGINVVSARIFFVGLFVFGLGFVAYAADRADLGQGESKIEFVGTKPGASHRGGFKKFSVDAAMDWGDLSQSSFKIDIDTTSLWSDNNALTNHLSNSDFFAVSRYPSITFADDPHRT